MEREKKNNRKEKEPGEEKKGKERRKRNRMGREEEKEDKKERTEISRRVPRGVCLYQRRNEAECEQVLKSR